MELHKLQSSPVSKGKNPKWPKAHMDKSPDGKKPKNTHPETPHEMSFPSFIQEWDNSKLCAQTASSGCWKGMNLQEEHLFQKQAVPSVSPQSLYSFLHDFQLWSPLPPEEAFAPFPPQLCALLVNRSVPTPGTSNIWSLNTFPNGKLRS